LNLVFGAGNFASHREAKIELNEVRIVKRYLNLATNGKADLEERRGCVYALANSLYHEENHAAAASVGVGHVIVNHIIRPELVVFLKTRPCVCSQTYLIRSTFDFFEIGDPLMQR